MLSLLIGFEHYHSYFLNVQQLSLILNFVDLNYSLIIAISKIVIISLIDSYLGLTDTKNSDG